MLKTISGGNMKILFRLAITVAAFALIASRSHAGQSERLVQEGRAFNASVNQVLIPFQAKDVFRLVPQCGMLDIKTIRPFSLKEAFELLNPCIEGINSRYGVSLKARPGIVSLSAGIKGGVPGIVIETGAAPIISPVMRDLNHALSNRDHRIFGHPVRVIREGVIRPLSQSVVQQSIDRCMLPTVVRRIRNSADFLKIYGGCITGDKSLKVLEMRPWSGDDLVVTIQSAADRLVIESLNGTVSVNPGHGPVSVMIVAYPKRIYLP